MKQKQQIGVFLALMVVAIMLWFGTYRGRPVVDGALNLKDDFALSVDNPQIRLDQIERARKTEYKSSGRNPFSPIQAAPARIAHVDKKPEPFGPQLPPPPPPLALPSNLKFYGFGTVPNGTSRLAFFTDGEEVYVVAEGDVLLKRFRILRIGNASLEFEEISSGRTGTAPLEEQPPGGSP